MNLASVRSLFLRPGPLPRLSRPALVLGSAPGATIPQGSDGWHLATVNASQVTQARTPDLTLMGTAVLRNRPVNKEAKAVLVGHSTKHLISVTTDKEFGQSRLRLCLLGYHYPAFSHISQAERAEIIAWATGIEDGLSISPSNGINLAFVCLKLGAPFVVMSGISFSRAGHAYNDQGRERRHVDHDKVALRLALERNLPLFAADLEFSRESQVPYLESANSGPVP